MDDIIAELLASAGRHENYPANDVQPGVGPDVGVAMSDINIAGELASVAPVISAQDNSQGRF